LLDTLADASAKTDIRDIGDIAGKQKTRRVAGLRIRASTCLGSELDFLVWENILKRIYELKR
jgi:hypothetical protein